MLNSGLLVNSENKYPQREQSTHLSTALALELLRLCPDPAPPPKRATSLMCDPSPLILFVAALLRPSACITGLVHHSHCRPPTMNKIQNSGGVLFDPPATPFAASPQQTSAPTHSLHCLQTDLVLLPSLKVTVISM